MEENEVTTKKWYQKTWVITLLLVFVFPVGIFLMWKYSEYGHKTKIALTVFFGLIFASNVMVRSMDLDNAPPPSKVEESGTKPAAQIEQKTPEQVKTLNRQNLPNKISVMPSIGAVREEFEKVFKENARNGNTYSRYNNDGVLVMFSDKNENRAISVTLQPLAENNYLQGIKIEEFLPSDAVTIGEKHVGINHEIKGSSEILKQVYPESKGNFTLGWLLDAPNGKLVSTTITIF